MNEDGEIFPIIDLAGSARDRGLAHGEALRDRIALGIEVMAQEISARTSRPLPEACAEFLAETSFTGAISRWTPQLLEETRAIAQASGFPYETILVYSLMDEWGWYSRERYGAGPPLTGCSAIGLQRGAGGHPVVSQTHDLAASYAGTLAILRIRDDDGTTALVLTAAGSIALSGVNDRGVALSCNSLVEKLPHSRKGLPVAFVIRGVLSQPTLAAAREFVEVVPHASGQNYVLGGPEGVCDLECSAERVVEVDAGRDLVLHTNHPIAQADGSNRPDADSRARLAFLEARESELRSLQHVQAVLATPPVCKGVETVAAIASELSVPPRVFMTAGAPDRAPWRRIPFQ